MMANETPDVCLDRVHLEAFGGSSLDFEVVYYVTNPDFDRHMDAQQTMILAPMEAFGEYGIGFASRLGP